jgi:hypothetical protein
MADAPVTWHLPVVDTESERFWIGAREGKLMIMHCRPCDKPYFYPRRYCPRCWSDDTEWRQASGLGTVHTYSIVHQNPAPPFRDWAPYAVLLVDLEEGVRVMANWDRGADLEQLAVGIAVEVTFERASDEISLPRFRPVKL